MKAVWARVIILSMLVMGTTILFASAVSTNASAASVDGKWVSRVSGQGYTQTFPDPYGTIITRSYDAELVLSVSGSSVTGTLTVNSESYSVSGNLYGDTFTMTLFWGWDGVSYCEGVYTLTVTGDEMYGSGSYLNVGVTIHGTFDLKKAGLFAVGGITPVVSGVTITVSIIAIVIALVPAGVPMTALTPQTTQVPPGPPLYTPSQPQTTWAPPAPPLYTPSQQWTTDVPSQPMSGDGTVSQGGIGLHYAQPPTYGRPAPPREHFTNVSQSPPRCPIHNGVALTPHYFKTDGTDPGSWYCSMCKNYPWGKN